MACKHKPIYPIYILVSIVLIFIPSCSTGIENTKTIKMTKAEQRITQATEEDRMMSDIVAPIVSEWETGKPFLVSDNKASLVFESSSRQNTGSELEGKIIRYKGTSLKVTPIGTEELVIVFYDGASDYRYVTGKSPDIAKSAITSLDIPMLIDLDLVKKTSDFLSGRKLWTRTKMWYTLDGEKLDGRQFVPVTVDEVQPGNMVFPLKVFITDENGRQALLFMNIKNSGIESRSFQSLFYVSDPKLRYPSILPEIWEFIRDGKVKAGMTKEECKLALGNPSDVNAGHDWNSTIEFWQYPDGKFLRFEDGLLIDYRN